MIWYLNPDYTILRLTDRMEVVYNGHVIAHVEYTEQAAIRDIWVATEHRQQGIARHLIRLVEQETGCMPTAMPPVSDLGRLLFPL